MVLLTNYKNIVGQLSKNDINIFKKTHRAFIEFSYRPGGLTVGMILSVLLNQVKILKEALKEI